MTIKWHIEKRKIKELKDHPKNPRILSKDQEKQLCQSLGKFGIIDKPCINLDNTLIGGHQRKRILKKLGYDEIEVYVPNRQLTENEVDELCITLNKAQGQFDYDMLANEWEVDLLFDLGFTAQDFGISNLIEEENPKPTNEKLCPHCQGKL